MLRMLAGIRRGRRAGDVVEIRSRDEILATLDEHGMLDGLPFMPEMLRYCGKRFRVAQVAHKTCDTIHYSGIRRMHAAVHLEGLRCDGSGHGGCQAACLMFWKEAWLKPVEGPDSRQSPAATARCSLEALTNATVQGVDPDGTIRYQCQITRLPQATAPWAWWNPLQYAADVVTGNWSLARTLQVLTLASIRRLIRFNFGVRILIATYDSLARRFGMHPFRTIEHQAGPIPKGGATPTSDLDLRPGDRVRVRSRDEIVATLNKVGRNRGMHFDPEMVSFCGGSYTIRDIVTKIIEEGTGRMMVMKNPCVMLEGVVCKGEYSGKRLLCPRAIPPYFRPLWLQKLGPQESAALAHSQTTSASTEEPRA